MSDKLQGSGRRSRYRSIVSFLLAALGLYLLSAYLLLPFVWRRYTKRHPALEDAPRITHTVNGIAGDPLNIGLVGTEEELQVALLAAKWFPADPITLRSSLRIAAGTVLRRSYDGAPVSTRVSRLVRLGARQHLGCEFMENAY
jgi:LssY C-terminus